MFENSLRIIEECDLSFLHVFPYSPRQGTPAARMPQVEKSLIKERAARLREVGQRNLEKTLHRFMGHEVNVLLEAETQGYSEHFLKIHLTSSYRPGTLLKARITGVKESSLEAERVL